MSGSSARANDLETAEGLREYCSRATGQGRGRARSAAPAPKPRDFTTGSSSSAPRRRGLFHRRRHKRVIRLGMPYRRCRLAGPFRRRRERRRAVCEAFPRGFADRPRPQAHRSAVGAGIQQGIGAEGRELYAQMVGVALHGDSGRGEGPSGPPSPTTRPRLRAADLTYRWTFRGGPSGGHLPDVQHRRERHAVPSFFDSLKPGTGNLTIHLLAG